MNRKDNNSRNDREEGRKPFRNDRKFDRKPERKYDDRKNGDFKSGDRKFSDRNNRDRNNGNRKFGDRNGGDRKFNDRKSFNRSSNDRRESRKGSSNKGPRNSKGSGDKTLVQPHKMFPGIFTSRSRSTDVLCTQNLTPGHTVYGEKAIVTSNGTEYRTWNPHRSKLAAGIVSGLDNIHIKPGTKVLYLGAASGTSVSHVSDILKEGAVYAVEFSNRSGRDLVTLARKRPNIVPIIEDARHPQRYRMVVPMVDVIFSDVAQPDQARIVALNAQYFLKDGGAVLMSIKANCVDCTKAPAEVFAMEVDKLRKEGIKPKEQVELDPFEKDHAMVVGIYKFN